MHEKLTIFEQFKELELQEKKRIEDCAEAIKKIHAAGPDLPVTLPRRAQRGAGNVAKFSPNGEFIGWYRENQTSGKPNRLMPIEQDLQKQYQQYKNSVISAFPVSVTASILGTRSGELRKEQGLSQPILDMQQQLMRDGTPKHHQVKLIAKALNCTPEFIRRTLRQHKNTK